MEPDIGAMTMDASQALAAEYSEKAVPYARLWSPVIRPMALGLLPAMPLNTARRVLDVGTGTGSLFADLRNVAPQATIIGVDRAEGMLRVAQRAGHRPLAVTDAQRLAIRSETIDAVVLIFVLFHLPEPSLGLREAYRVLRDGGRVGVLTWGSDPGSPGLSIWREELDRVGAAPDPRNPRVMQQALMDTPDKLEHLFHDVGFAQVSVRRTHVVHQWTLEDLLAVHEGCGMPSRRLAGLSPERREQCRSRVRLRLEQLTQAELEYHPEVLLAIGSRLSAMMATMTTSRNGHVG